MLYEKQTGVLLIPRVDFCFGLILLLLRIHSKATISYCCQKIVLNED